MPLSWNEIKTRALAFSNECLFELYDQYTTGLFVKEKKKNAKQKA